MAQMNVEVRDRLKEWADARVGDGTYASTDALVDALLERAAEESAQVDWLNAELEKGRQSGPGRPVAEAMREIKARFVV